QPGDRAGRAVHPAAGLPDWRAHPAQAPRREGRPAAPGRPRRTAHRADQGTGQLPWRPGGRAVQAGPLPLLSQGMTPDAPPGMTPDAPPGPPSDIADAGLAEAGRARIGWAQRGMPVLRLITERYAGEQPFAGLTVAACLHVTAETAGLVGALRAGGARVFLAASNPLSTQDDVAAALADAGTFVFARAGVDAASYAGHIHRVLDPVPDLVIDDGGDLVDTLAGQRPELAANVRGGCESTSTGVLRLRRMAAAGALAFPMVAAAATTPSRMSERTAGTGQAVLDGVLRATNTLLAGRAVVVAGFGPCGQGIAARAHGLGAQVIVTEVDPVRALDAVLRGYRVLPMREAAAVGEVIITATGSRDVVAAEHLGVLAGGAPPAHGRALRRRGRRVRAGRGGGEGAPGGAPARRRVPPARRPGGGPAGRGGGGQPGRGRGEPAAGHGRLLRRPGARAALAGPRPREPGRRRAPRAPPPP